MAKRNFARNDKAKWVAVLIAIVLLAVAVAAAITQGFKTADPYGWFSRTEETGEEGNADGGMEFEESVGESNSIGLVSYAVPIEEYEEYGVMPIAESAQVLTATVYPDNTAPNSILAWTASFADSGSAWAKGKNVSDYIALSFGDTVTESKKCTVSCLKAFGEQIVIKATAVTNPQKFATVKADYRQKITDFSLSFGSIACNFNGNTNVTLDCDGGGEGGLPDLKPIGTRDYTLPASSTATYTLSLVGNDGVFVKAQVMSYYYNAVAFWDGWETPHNVASFSVGGRGLYFGYDWLVMNFSLSDYYSTSRGKVGDGRDTVGRAFTGGSDGTTTYTINRELFKLEVTYQGITKSTVFYVADVTYAGISADGVSDVALDKSAIEF